MQVDVTQASNSIDAAVTGGSLVLLTLMGGYGLFLGYKLVCRILKRESGFNNDMWIGWDRKALERDYPESKNWK